MSVPAGANNVFFANHEPPACDAEKASLTDPRGRAKLIRPPLLY